MKRNYAYTISQQNRLTLGLVSNMQEFFELWRPTVRNDYLKRVWLDELLAARVVTRAETWRDIMR